MAKTRVINQQTSNYSTLTAYADGGGYWDVIIDGVYFPVHADTVEEYIEFFEKIKKASQKKDA